jgi:hypothetical protein
MQTEWDLILNKYRRDNLLWATAFHEVLILALTNDSVRALMLTSSNYIVRDLAK